MASFYCMYNNILFQFELYEFPVTSYQFDTTTLLSLFCVKKNMNEIQKRTRKYAELKIGFLPIILSQVKILPMNNLLIYLDRSCSTIFRVKNTDLHKICGYKVLVYFRCLLRNYRIKQFCSEFNSIHYFLFQIIILYTKWFRFIFCLKVAFSPLVMGLFDFKFFLEFLNFSITLVHLGVSPN